MPKVSQDYLNARRAEILDAAWACLARNGYHNTTMQDIATEAGLSYGAVYTYFPSKEQVLHAIFDRISEVGRTIVDTATATVAGPRNVLEAIGRVTFGNFAQDNFDSVTRADVEIWPEMLRDDSLREKFREGVYYWHGVVTRLLSESQQRGELRPDVDPATIAALDMCAFEGLRRYRLIAPDLFEPEPIRQLLETLAERGGTPHDDPD
jgi:AcrR family transcriptional regulator